MPSLDPRDILARRLRQARTMRGLSLRGLSEALGGMVSYNALSKYEKGQMMPGSAVVIALADALNVTPDFLFRQYTVELTGVSFRKRSKLGKKEEKRIAEEARGFFERYFELEEALCVREEFEAPVNIPVVESEADADQAAGDLRTEWGLGQDALPNVCELLEEKGIKVHEVEAPESFDGFSGHADGSPVVVLGTWLNHNVPRKRMTLVHELAHVALCFDEGLTERERESRVRRFAGAFLLPREALEPVFGRPRAHISLQELIELKAVYGASIMATLTRAYQLGYIGEASYRQFCMYAGKQGWRSHGEPGDDQFPGDEKSHRFRLLVYRALAEEAVSMSKAAALLGTSLETVRNEFSVVA